VASESVAHDGDTVDDGLGETPVAQLIANGRCNFLPKGIAEFFMHALVADDRELMRARGKVEQDRIAFTGGGHALLFEPARRARNDVVGSDLAVADKDADFTGRPAFGISNGANNFSIIELSKKILRFHGDATIYRWPLLRQSFRLRR
jgi:hypothetical protein